MLKNKSSKTKVVVLISTVLTLALTLIIIAIGVRLFFVQTYNAPTASMSPTIKQGDKLQVKKYSYWFSDPERGDIVVDRKSVV